MKTSAWVTPSLLLMATAVSASPWASLIDLPVAGTANVPEASFRTALAGVARNASPIELALAVTGVFEGGRQLIAQTNEGVESASAARVTVLRDGLLDDAVGSERWDIDLARTTSGTWEVRRVAKSWRCRRGQPVAAFTAQRCP